jgi:hypothetical protein
MERHNDLNTLKIAAVGFLAALVTFAFILALQVLYYSSANEQHDRKVIQAPTTQSDTLLAEQAVKLTRYDWIDRGKQTVMVPIDRAMELVVKELSATQTQERSNDR